MPREPGFRREFRFPWRTQRQVLEDVDAELAFHLEEKANELIALGMSPDDARREARRQFGDLDFTRRYCLDEDARRERETRQMHTLEDLRQDVTYALRALRAAPGFTLVALLTLALGIGAGTAVFSVVRGVLLRPLPFGDADRVARVWQASTTGGSARSVLSEPDFRDWAAASRRFASLAGYFFQPGAGKNLTGNGTPERLEGAFITEHFFETLRTPAMVGRAIRPEEAVRGNDRYVVLSHAFWRRRFAEDRSVVGRAVTLDGEPFTVVGVMPPEFTYPADRIDFWLPLSAIPADDIGRHRSARFLDVVGRLAPGATIAQARDELSAVLRRTAEQFPEHRDWTDVTILPIREAIVGEVQRPLLVLFGAVTFVLLITCANIAGLLLSRATTRAREIAVRSALGAGRGRILRQLVTESLVLALAGGALGVGLAWLGVRALGAVGAADLPRAASIRLDTAVLLYALVMSTVAGLLFGLLPALRATSADVQSVLRAGGRGSVGAGQRLRGTLVIAEVALGVVLAVGAGLAARSFVRLLDVDPGFRPENVLAVRLNVVPEAEGDFTERYPAYYQALLERIAAVPGVQVVGAAKSFPLRGMGESVTPTIPGRTLRSGEENERVNILHVSADYFRALGIPLRAGRSFTAADRGDAPPVLIVNEAFARKYWPGQNAVGKALLFGGQPVPIVGVAGDVRQRSLAEPPEPMLYIHYLQNPRSGLSLAVRTAGDPIRHANAVREAIWSVNRNQTITSMETMTSIVGDSMSRPRLLAALLLLFGAMGLSLAALGIYGVLAYAVSQRRQEIGVRVALGATPRTVLGLVVRQGMALALAGVVAGIAGALALTRVMTALLYDVRATDPLTFASVVLVLLATALVASWLPARRALRIDPMQALRCD